MSERKIHEPIQVMARHIVTRIGTHAGDDACAPGLHLHLSPALFDPDGHVAFGVLGAFVDLASSQPEGMWIGRPFVHAELGLHRLARPQSDLLLARPSAARLGGRTAVVEVDVVDTAGTRVAYSTQQLVFMGPPPPSTPSGRAEFHRAFMSRFDGTGTLDAPLLEVLDVRRGLRGDGSPSWWMPGSDLNRNGFGGLHGGVTTALVDAAAAAAVADATGVPARTVASSLRYLTPGTAGPFRADPTVLSSAGSPALVRVAVVDEGADDQLIVLAEAQTTPTR